MSSTGPTWDTLYQTAAGQDGYFTTQQAAEAGYSRPLLTHHTRQGNIERVARHVYRIVHFPPADQADLIVLWLWSRHQAIFSHETALALHGLSDVMPARTHLTLPSPWRRRRVVYPEGVVAHYADVPDAARGWFGCVPVTLPLQTIRDCHAAHVSPDLLHQAIDEGVARGLFSAAQVEPITQEVAP
jgi:predicted transcriptional regulator of viral defense system